MGAAQSTRIESSLEDIACPCATNYASGQENTETYKTVTIEEEIESSDDGRSISNDLIIHCFKSW